MYLMVFIFVNLSSKKFNLEGFLSSKRNIVTAKLSTLNLN